MNMQQFTGWLTRLLNALPWRQAKRPARQSTQARIAAPRSADRFAVPDSDRTRRQKAETNPLCSTLHEDAPTTPESASADEPTLLPASAGPELTSAALPALPPALASNASAEADADLADAAPVVQVDPARRLAFARYLVRRGVFNEGFSREKLPAQYRRTRQD